MAFDKNDLDIKSMLEVKEWLEVYQSPHFNANNLLFPKIRIETSKLCGGSLNLPIKVKQK